ncbi:MAG: hypothetical protein EXR72_15760 [Myxococcales bacterium]|nr:hypothetical protein [Myxococcales bacterium]
MRPSLWSIGLFMIVLGGVSLGVAQSHGISPTASSGIAAAGLAIGGLTLILGRPWSVWFALGGGAITVGFALASFILKREVGLPLPPIISLVAGLYVCVRIVMARSALKPRSATPEET